MTTKENKPDVIKFDLTGLVFGRLTVIRYVGKTQFRNSIWECKCSCGVICIKNDTRLKKPSIPSCGCAVRDRMRVRATRHGNSNHPLYAVWKSMHNRCYNKNNHAWDRYGGRGITVNERWHDFDNFVADVHPSFPGKGYSIDRIDNNKGYGPDNWKWATYTEQNNNRRDNVKHNYRGQMLTVPQIARLAGVNSGSLSSAISRRGLTAEEAVSQLLRRKKVSCESAN